MDNAARFCFSYEAADLKNGHNATNLLEMAKKYGRKIPYEFVTDALGSYIDAFKCSHHVTHTISQLEQ